MTCPSRWPRATSLPLMVEAAQLPPLEEPPVAVPPLVHMVRLPLLLPAGVDAGVDAGVEDAGLEKEVVLGVKLSSNLLMRTAISPTMSWRS